MASDHSDAYVVAGYQTPLVLQPPRRADGRFEVGRLELVRAGSCRRTPLDAVHELLAELRRTG